MAKTDNPAPQEQSKAGGAGRGISYPAISLSEAVTRAQEFWDHERKNAAPLDAAAAHWGYSPSSSGVRTLAAALLSYGLMVDRGSGPNRQIQLSERALDIILETPERTQALIDAVKSPKIYTELLTEWSPKDLPSDQTIRAHLLRHKNFNPKAVDGFIKDFRASISFSGLSKLDNMPSEETEQEGTMEHVDSSGRERVANALLTRSVFGPGVEVASFPVAKDCIIRLRATGPLTKSGVENLIKQLQLGLDIELYPDTETDLTKDKAAG